LKSIEDIKFSPFDVKNLTRTSRNQKGKTKRGKVAQKGRAMEAHLPKAAGENETSAQLARWRLSLAKIVA
jgi:hypothetical protein